MRVGVAATGDPDTAPWAPDEAGSRDFAAAADAAPVPMWTTKPDGSRGFVNRAYCEMMGLSYAQALQVDWRTLIHPDDVARIAAATQAGLAAGGTFGFEGRFRRAAGDQGGGGWRWLRAVTRPRRDADGHPLGHVGVAHDISDAKEAELALRARERQLSVLIDQTAAGIAQVDLTGRFTLVNDRFCAIVGRSRDDLLTLTARAITHPDDLARNDEQMADMLGEGRPLMAEKRYLKPDGTTVWVSNSVATTRNADGSPYSIIAVTLDITARHEAEAVAAQSRVRLEFLDVLGKATATAIDADQVLAITTRLLGERLRASDCAYADMEADGDTFHIRGDWHVQDGASIIGTYSLATFGSRAVADLHAGRPLVIDDVAAIEGDGAAAFRAIGIGATICMPFIKGDQLAALMAVHAARARHWAPDELALVREVTERSWAHVERVRAEAALRDSERQLRLALAGARIGTWHWDPLTERGGWSPRTAEIMGVPHDRSLSQREQAQMIHPDDRARVMEGSARLATGGNDFATEYRIVRPDGAVRWIASHGLIMRDEAGTPVRAIGTIRDVTARREAQEELERLNQTLEAQIVERTAERDRMWTTSPDLMLVIDAGGVFRRVNPAWTMLLGYSTDELVGHHVNEFVVPDDHSATVAAYEAAANGARLRLQNRYRHKDGSIRWIAWVAAPADGLTYATGRDITAEREQQAELEQAQEALRQAQKMESLGALTGGVAHDFNNLLTPILGGLDLLARDESLPERRRRLIRNALESAERARVLVQRLLAFARRQPLLAGPLDLQTLFDGLSELLASTVGPQVELAIRVAPGLPAAMADANQLELALLNLAVNARDAMPEGGRLTIAALPVTDPPDLPPGRYVAISVADTGTGMDADTLARAAEPFFSTKGVGRGTGLGLSMVHGLASQLGGAMRLDSRPGTGTRVALLLPVAAMPATAPVAEPAPMTMQTGRVLLVDDEDAVRRSTAELLESLGFEVASAASGEAALGMLDGVDYLVTDHLMPGMKGAELAQRARGARPALKVLVISGYAGLDEIPPELPRLAKPFRVDELARRMGELA